MARRSTPKSEAAAQQSITASADDLLLAILEQGGDTTKTGRFLMTFKEGGAAAGVKSLQSKRGLRVANARDFKDQAVSLAEAGDAHAMVFPEIGVALVGGGRRRRAWHHDCRVRRRGQRQHSRSIPNISCSHRR